MTESEKIEFLMEIMDYEGEPLTRECRLSEIEEWESLSALSLVVEMKHRYGMDLTTERLTGFKTVGDICDYIPNA